MLWQLLDRRTSIRNVDNIWQIATMNVSEQDNHIEPVYFWMDSSGIACENVQAVAKEQSIHVHSLVQWAQSSFIQTVLFVHGNSFMLKQIENAVKMIKDEKTNIHFKIMSFRSTKGGFSGVFP